MGSKCWTLLDASNAEVTLAPKDVMYLPQGTDATEDVGAGNSASDDSDFVFFTFSHVLFGSFFFHAMFLLLVLSSHVSCFQFCHCHPPGVPHHAAALAVHDPSLHLAVALHRRPMSLSSVLAALLTLRKLVAWTI